MYVIFFPLVVINHEQLICVYGYMQHNPFIQQPTRIYVWRGKYRLFLLKCYINIRYIIILWFHMCVFVMLLVQKHQCVVAQLFG